MARALRHHLPGVPFHLTARLQGRAPLFRGIEPTVTRLLQEHALAAGGDLLAYVVMPNHLHAIYVQGSLALSSLMQPLLRRIAILIHSRHRSEGHVFQRRFFSVPCANPEYLRNSILYLHLNPVRAGYCGQPEEYCWSSQSAYAQVRHWDRTGPSSGLRLFAAERGSAPSTVYADYRTWLAWRLNMDACMQHSSRHSAADQPYRPASTAGDEYWIDRFGWACTGAAERQLPRRPVEDLRDLAARLIRSCDPPVDLDLLRSGNRTRALVAVRREFIGHAKERGYRNRAIARFLRVSDVTVSRT